VVSMKQIAELCGVSVATVSKALNGHKDISEETREIIRRKADELGYMTNSAARMLKTNRSYNLGVLFEDQGGRGLTHEFFATVLEGFKAEAANKGYDITFINRTLMNGTSGYLRHCNYRGFDGVGIICVDFYDPDVMELIQSDIPVVTVDHVFNNRISVVSDNFEGLEALVDYAYKRGHRKIAYVHGDVTAVTQMRLTGYYRACENHGIPVEEGYVRSARYYDASSSYEAATALLQSENRPTCIIFPDDFSLIGGIRAIKDAGLRMPEDVSVMGYDGIIVSQVMSPRITTYHQKAELIGKTAAAKLIDMIDHPNTTIPEKYVIHGELVEAESVTPPEC